MFNNIQFIGEGSAFSELLMTSFYLSNNDTIFLFECNADTFKYIKANDFRKFNYWVIAISHLHEDHCGMLGNLFYYLKYIYQIPDDNINIIGPLKLRRYLNLVAPGLLANITYSYKNHNIKIETFNVAHSKGMESIGFKFYINNKCEFAYTGDCNLLPIDIVDDFNSNIINYLITECTLNDESTVHLPLIHILNSIRRKRLSHLKLVHFDSEEDKKYILSTIQMLQK